jgi:non-specific serine/threonine protein kinase
MAAGLTQGMLAERAGLSERGVQDLERGVRQAPHADTVLRLADAMDLPDEDRAALHAAVGRPPAVAGGGKGHNLPNELSSFVGRDDTVANVRSLLSTASLVTLTGLGGIGKSRLAVRVAAEMLPVYPDGVWLVELAPTSDPRLVAQTVATILGAREQPNVPLVHTLGQVIGNGRVLLVLDNCEHVIQACADLTETLLRTCRNLSVLATSRERLAVVGELALSVPPLAVPDPNRVFGSLPELQQYPAVQLFVDRARAVVPSFALTRNNAKATAKVCACLDGVPLALELAAARTTTLSAEQLASRLDDRLRLLVGGSRTAPPRHQTLWAVVDWSYALLSEPERRLFERLSVFSGGWSLESAEAVCAGDGIEIGEVLDLLSHLVDKSLVIVDHGADEEVRYRMLEIVREHAARALARQGDDLVKTRSRHLGLFLELAERAESSLLSPDQAECLRRLQQQHDNLIAALSWSVDDEHLERQLLMAGYLWMFWDFGNHPQEGRAILNDLLARDRKRSKGRVQSLWAAGFLTWLLGDPPRATTLWEEGLALARALGDLPLTARLLAGVGSGALWCADLTRAVALLDESLNRARAQHERWTEAAAMYWLGLVALSRGKRMDATHLLEQSINLIREVGDRRALTYGLLSMAQLIVAEGDPRRYVQAATLLPEAARLGMHLGDLRNTAWSVQGLAWLASVEGHATQAARLLGAEQRLWDQLGVPPAPPPTQGLRAAQVETATSIQKLLGQAEFAAALVLEEGRTTHLEELLALTQFSVENSNRASK